MFNSIWEWLRAPRANIAPPLSVVPFTVKSDDAARYHFYPPKPGVPRIINTVDRGDWLGVGMLPATGPRQ